MMAIVIVLRLLRDRDVLQTRAVRAALHSGQPPAAVTIEQILSCGMNRVEVTRPAFRHQGQVLGIRHGRFRIFAETFMFPLANKPKLFLFV